MQSKHIFTISAMICQAYTRRDSPSRLNLNIKGMLGMLTVDQLNIILAYLKKNTTELSYGSTNNKNSIILDILNLICRACRIDVDSASITELTNIFVFFPESVGPYNTPSIVSIETPDIQRLFIDIDSFLATAPPAIRAIIERTVLRTTPVGQQVPSPPRRRRSTRVRARATMAPPPAAPRAPRRAPPRAFIVAQQRRLAQQQPLPPPIIPPPPPNRAWPPGPPPPPPTPKVLKFDEDCDETGECPICYQGLVSKTFVKLNCSHTFCKSCIKSCINSNIKTCPMCRIRVTEIYTQNPVVVAYTL